MPPDKKREYTKPDFINKAKTDDYYLEVVAFIIFVMGFSFKTVKVKWPGIHKAFNKFKVNKVATYDERTLKKLLTNKDIIRNRKKVAAIVTNAQRIKAISKEYGSVQKWINKTFRNFEKDPIRNDHPLDVGKKAFHGIGDMTIKWFYWSAGKHME
jgi:3-methyladenine DNA glycosylase Tag